MFIGLLRVLCLLAAAGALAYRLWPLAVGEPWLSQFFITEDGYLMLTVARNMALGLGMSTAEGTIPTNGVQPLATYLFAGIYRLAEGDKLSGLAGISLLSIGWSLLGLLAVRAFARQILPSKLKDPVWPWLVGVLWFSGPLLLRHSMNALETGLYTALVVLSLLWFLRVLRLAEDLTLRESLAFGALCGLTFLARNDAVFLLAAIFGAWTLHELAFERSPLRMAARRLLPAAVTCLAVATPWLLHNLLRFGAIVPVSGTAQQMNSELGQNLGLLPIALFEHAFPMLPIPQPLESSAALRAIACVALAMLAALFVLALRPMRPRVKLVIAVYAAFGLMLCGYYGTFFGAPHFISRYLAPLAPLLILMSVMGFTQLMTRMTPRFALQAVAVTGILGLILSSGLLLRQLRPGTHEQGHFQVVEWVSGHLGPEIWVGAVQTGTLGYWHDRTINLDGKVNPAALNARIADGHVLNYVIDSQISHITDWYGITGWLERDDTRFPEHFEQVQADEGANLGVLGRKVAR